MNTELKIIKECRLCGSIDLVQVLDFGESPLANSYPEVQDSKEKLYPLSVAQCSSCGHVQLEQTVSPEILFSNYLYASSDSPALKTHFSEYAKDLVNKLKLGENNSILEIGCNDGILLKEFEKLGFVNLVGVEPAQNIAEKAKVNTSAFIVSDFFNLSSAIKIGETKGKFNLICANNVFAHVAELESLVLGVKHLLTNEGIFVFENAYLLDTIRNLYFDQIYHEHLQYYGVRPLVSFLKSHGLEVFDVKRVNTQGGSIRVFVKSEKNYTTFISPNVRKFIEEEENFGLYRYITYLNFKEKLSYLDANLNSIIGEAKKNKETVSCYGCPAKFALFSKYFGLDNKVVKYVVDDSPLKQGRFSPGSKIPIVSRDHFINNPTDYCLISVWNMADSVIEKNKQYSGKFIVPLPNVKIIKNN